MPSTAYLDHLAEETAAKMREAVAPGSAHSGASEALTETVEVHAAALAEDLDHIVTALHTEPEVAFAEHRSAATLIEVLRRHGVHAELGVHGLETAFRAEVRGRSDGPTIAVLAEYDALPGLGHACGHNVIAATGVGAFLALAATLEQDPAAFGGRVVLLGTPAEEGHSGKEIMARHGAFDGLDAAIMAHPYGYDLADQVWLGRRLLRWTFTGTAAHASAQPFMGRNAMDAAALAYQGVGLLRQQLPPVDRVHAVVAEGGTRPSIITERAVVDLYARSKYPDTLKDLSARLDDIATGAALMSGTAVAIDWDAYPPTLPVRTNGVLSARWIRAQQRRGRDPLPAGVVSETLAASTDFGNVSYRIPGIHPLIRIASPGIALHTAEFADAANSPAARSAALDGAAGLALTALDFLCDEDLRAAVQAEFADQGGALEVARYFD